MIHSCFFPFVIILLLIFQSSRVICIQEENNKLLTNYIVSGEKELVKGNYRGCIDFLINALQINERNSNVHQMIGTAYIQLNNYDKAINHLKRSLELSDYSSSYVMANYVEALRASNRRDEASQIGHQYLLRFNNEPIFVYNLALIDDQRGDHNNAINLYQQYIQLVNQTSINNMNGKSIKNDGLYYEAWRSLSEIFIFVKRDFLVAEKLVSLALQEPAMSQDYYFYNLLGMVYQFQNKFQEAIQCYETVLKLHPQHYFYDSVHHMAAAYQSLGKLSITTSTDINIYYYYYYYFMSTMALTD